MALKSVSALVLDGLAIFEFGVICEVFGIDRSADGVPNFDFKVCGPEPGKPLRTSVGATITPEHGLDELVGSDLVAIPAISVTPGRRRTSFVNVPKGPSARTRVPSGSERRARVKSPHSLTVMRNRPPCGAAESENGCACHQRSFVRKRQRKN